MNNSAERDAALAKIAIKFADIMDILGLDRKDPSLCDTPLRVAKMYYDELAGRVTGQAEIPNMTTFPLVGEALIVQVTDFPFSSVCEHHFMPFMGTAKIFYFPEKECILGLSKFPRIVQYLAQKPQVQERLTLEIYETLAPILGDTIAVYLEAEHTCMSCRGARSSGKTVTTYIGGKFREQGGLIREELFRLLQKF